VDIQFPQILFQIINFGIIAFVLTKFIYKPIIKILEQRSQKIEAGLTAAEKNQSLQEELEAEKKAMAAKARQEADALKAESLKEAQKKATEIIAKAKSDASKAIDSERVSLMATIEAEKVKAKKDIAGLITSGVTQILKDGLSEQDQRRIIAAQIKKIKIA
jgi:F-type H+-transporting ATPase subunit b